MDENAWREFHALMDAALGDRPPALQRRLQVFLRAIEWLPVLRFGRRFSSLSPAQRARFLSSLENHAVQMIRSGFWGLRTLVLLGYYGRPDAVAAIGYAADARGWEARIGWDRYFGVGKRFGLDAQGNASGHGESDVDQFTAGVLYRF